MFVANILVAEISSKKATNTEYPSMDQSSNSPLSFSIFTWDPEWNQDIPNY